MSYDLIPLETWFGYTEKIEDKTVFKAGQPFKFKGVGPISDETIESLNNNLPSIHRLVVMEFVIGINAILETDIMMWPEGIREDGSNFLFKFNKATGKLESIQLWIDTLEVEDREKIAFRLGEDEEQSRYVASDVLPNFSFVINNETTIFMDLITDPETAEVLRGGGGVTAKLVEGAPAVTVIKVDPEAAIGHLAEEIVSREILNVAFVRYINKYFPNLIHEDLISLIVNSGVVEDDNGNEVVYVTFKIGGVYYCARAVFDYDYQLPEHEMVDLDEE